MHRKPIHKPIRGNFYRVTNCIVLYHNSSDGVYFYDFLRLLNCVSSGKFSAIVKILTFTPWNRKLTKRGQHVRCAFVK